jgi:hypothetical protein
MLQISFHSFSSRSLVRTIQNNLMDAGKQEAFDLLLLGTSLADRRFAKAAALIPAPALRAGFYFYGIFANKIKVLLITMAKIFSYLKKV